MKRWDADDWAMLVLAVGAAGFWIACGVYLVVR